MSAIYNFFYPKNSITGQRELCHLPNLPTSVGTIYGKMMQRKYRCELGALARASEDLSYMEAKINYIVNTLALHAQRAGYLPFDYEVTLIERGELMAESYPGGKMIFSSHFINHILSSQKEEELTKDDILAAPVAHEMAHVMLGHCQKNLETALFCCIGSILSSVGLKVTTFAYLLNYGSLKMKKIFYLSLGLSLCVRMQKHVSPQRSRKQEYEADKLGVELMNRAGYDMKGSLAALKSLAAFKKDPSYFTGEESGMSATHPPIQKRLEANEKTIQEIEKKNLEHL